MRAPGRSVVGLVAAAVLALTGPGGRVRISSGGARSWVWQIALPDPGDDVPPPPLR